MRNFKAQLQDKLWLTGIRFIVLSLFFFCIPFFAEMNRPDLFNLFIPNFLLAAVYFCIILFKGRLKRGREGLHPLFLFFILFFISAWSLNREMSVSEESTTWFSVLQVIVCLNYVVFAFFHSFKRSIQYLLCFILGTGMIAFLYLSFYLLPLYAISAVASLLLGISLHTFVPLLFLIYSITLLNKVTVQDKKYWFVFVGGAGTVLLFVVGLVIQWSAVTREINKAYRKASVADSEGLPQWIAVAQEIPSTWLAERILKSDLIYSVPDNQVELSFFDIPQRNFGNEKEARSVSHARCILLRKIQSRNRSA